MVGPVAAAAAAGGVPALAVLAFGEDSGVSKLPPEAAAWRGIPPAHPGGYSLRPLRPSCAHIQPECPRCRCSWTAHRLPRSPGRSWASDCRSAECHRPRTGSGTPSRADEARHALVKPARLRVEQVLQRPARQRRKPRLDGLDPDLTNGAGSVGVDPVYCRRSPARIAAPLKTAGAVEFSGMEDRTSTVSDRAANPGVRC